jgi:hypothetical protein
VHFAPTADDVLDIKRRTGLQFFVVFENTGATPAKKAWCNQRHFIAPPLFLPPAMPPKNATESGSDLPSGGSQHGAPTYLRLETIDELILQKDKALFLAARVDYVDVFGAPRHSEVCVRIHFQCSPEYLRSEIIESRYVYTVEPVGPNNQST